MRDDLQKYLAKLNKYADESKMVIKELRSNKKKQCQQATLEINSIRSMQLKDVEKFYRQLAMIKLVRLQKRKVLEKHCAAIIQERITHVQQAIQQFDSAMQHVKDDDKNENFVLPAAITDDFFKGIDDILQSNTAMQRRWRSVKRIDTDILKMTDKYNAMKKQPPRSKRENGQLLHALLAKPEVQRFLPYMAEQINVPLSTKFCEFFPNFLEGSEQNEFRMLIGDSRTEEGKTIQTFLSEIKTYTLQKIPCHTIVNYIEV